MNLLLFVLTVLIWGSTWIAIALQVGPVPVLVSVFYRFAAAAVLYLALLAVLGRLRLPAARDQSWILAQALCLFCLNFLCFYAAAGHVPSGLLSVVFSLASIFNAVNARVFFGDPISGRTVLAALLGAAGVALLFSPDLVQAQGADTLRGLALAALGTMFFSLGNMVSRRNSAAGIPPSTASAWGMGYGALVLAGLIALTGTPMAAPPDATYLAALLYLAGIGTVLGFTTYLLMVARIGSSRAAYATVLFPVVALTISTVFEGYRWHWTGLLGLGLALLGNAVMFAPPLQLRAGGRPVGP
ncbi:DMT family transporter [Paracoccus sp. TOH]|uniref:DMT family transporter n=1 Tax=Paracoccus sp. TOH TaxID=1263728 RepID=UPI0025AFF4E7|nr:DMT family transporter [Paracoccus sp. TOH]WJS83860.1 DMT family transporter [Paracoccus sp. TOH]